MYIEYTVDMFNIIDDSNTQTKAVNDLGFGL